MRSDLYALLGVRRNARPETIHAAYRDRSKSAHPDTGGDAETFAKIKLAHDVLMDPDRRAKYDATGQYDQNTADNAMAELLSDLAWALDAALSMIPDGQDATHFDMVEGMRNALKSRLADFAKNRAALEKQRAAFEKLRGRFTVKKGPNFLDDMIASKIGNIDQAFRQIDLIIPRTQKALYFLEAYSWRQDLVQVTDQYLYMSQFSNMARPFTS